MCLGAMKQQVAVGGINLQISLFKMSYSFICLDIEKAFVLKVSLQVIYESSAEFKFENKHTSPGP